MFDFFHDLPSERPCINAEPSITNLIYWSNLMHDVWYKYALDEQAGNFQMNNYGKRGTGGDYVIAHGLNGATTNNAVFGTAADGSRAFIQMYIWTTEPLPSPTLSSNFYTSKSDSATACY